MVVSLLEVLSVWVRVCAYERAYNWWDEKHTSDPIAELPSNITHGLCFDPLASHSPQPPLKPCAYWTVCGPQGCMHSAPLSLLRSKFTPSCPYSHCQFLLCLFVSVCSAGPITAEQDLAVFPPHSAIRTLWGILLLLLLHSRRLFSKAQDSCSLPRSRESSLSIFCWILLELSKFELHDACLCTLGVLQERAVSATTVFDVPPIPGFLSEPSYHDTLWRKF